MSLAIDNTARELTAALDLREQRQAVLASNLANVDTPNYRPRDLAFEGFLADAGASADALPLARTAPGHLAAGEPPDGAVATDEVVERSDRADSMDLNGVDLDREVARFADNAVRFDATVEMFQRRLATLRYALGELGR